MHNFFNRLTCNGKNSALPSEANFFEKLIGSWSIEYIDCKTLKVLKGEWHFSWILDGMAIQDVILLPGYEYGTTLRIYNPATNAWDIAYGYTGKIMRFEANKVDNKIVLTNTEGERRKWVFVEIADQSFHWQDVMVQDDGSWQVNYDLHARRI